MHTPFIVKADLFQGAVFDTRFGVGLDSLLASQLRRQMKFTQGVSGRELDGGLAVNQVKIIDLPLSKCMNNNELWHWQSTMAQIFLEGNLSIEEEVSYFIQHTDIHALEQASALQAYPPQISEKRGRYRARKTPLVKTLGDTAIWHAIGDPEATYDLLRHIQSIGQRRSSGEGAVRKWEVIETSPENPELFIHSHDGSTLARPCPSECLDSLSETTGIVLTSTTQRAGLRPPYWHFGNMESVHVPPFKNFEGR